MNHSRGIHHITAIASNPQKNVDFYHAVLGQRLVKTTVNFDDPGTYHFYYGDETGSPGTILTFFPWKNMPKGRSGNGEVGAVAYRIASTALDYWRNRLLQHGVAHSESVRFGDTVLTFEDPDGMALELIASSSTDSVRHWKNGPIPPETALQGFHGVTLWVQSATETAQLLTEVMDYAAAGPEGNRFRFQATGTLGGTVDLLERPGQPYGQMGTGSVHHVAFRAANDEAQARDQLELVKAGHRVTSVKDRQYFRSIYFREPNGVLFEVATDDPGFLFDEPEAELGTNLKLPPWLESQRDQIEQLLSPFELPTFQGETRHGKS
jgi:glyoxalase family protein